MRDRGPSPDPMAGIDFDRLGKVCRHVARIGIDGEELLLIAPLVEIEDHMAFDREVCAAGLKKFIREGTSSEPERSGPLGLMIGVPGEYVIVEEFARGCRKRIGCSIVMNHEMN